MKPGIIYSYHMDFTNTQRRFMLYGCGLHGNGAWPYRRVLRGTLNVAPAWKRPASRPGRHPCHCAPSSLTARREGGSFLRSSIGWSFLTRRPRPSMWANLRLDRVCGNDRSLVLRSVKGSDGSWGAQPRY